MSLTERIHIPFQTAVSMVARYARVKLMTQVRSVAFIILYLAGFQMLVLRETPYPMLRITAGILMVVLGLALFLEGLLVGLMPLGERVGLQLPRRGGLFVIMLFGLLLGIGVTLAEPAIAALRGVGQNVTAWDTPLLFMLLERLPETLVAVIGVGVGLAVAAGMLRFYYGFSLKPFIYITIPAALLLSAYVASHEALAPILGLAWDTGAVTTGPVTVPLVLALGIGVSRSSTRHQESGGGFGVIMLASVLPVLSVLVFGIALHRSLPSPAPLAEADFFAPANRDYAMHFFRTHEDLRQHAFQRGGESARRAISNDDETYTEAIRSLRTPAGQRTLLAGMAYDDWLQRRASPEEQRLLAMAGGNAPAGTAADGREGTQEIVRQEGTKALKAVIPLTVLLLVVLTLLLKSRPAYWDETAFGIGMAVIGIALLTTGIRIGLAPLGDQVGRPLPRMFRSDAREEGRLLLEPFDPARVQTAFAPDGTHHLFFYMRDRDGVPTPVPFAPERYDTLTGRYEHVVSRPPLFGPQMTRIGIGLVLLFAFGLGYGSTLAEPALSALGRTVEEVTAGTIHHAGVVRAVSIGVGTGLVAGVCRILYDIPMLWMLLPPYLAVLVLTHWSEENFTTVAWDSGGVTTGVVTVPLVMAMGLGIGGELQVVDGFGVLAIASVYPVLTVLIYGMMQRARQRQAIRAIEKEQEHG